jgi:hypothetical protein
MPSHLLERLRRFLNQDIARDTMALRGAAHTDHWVPAPAPGAAMSPNAVNDHPHWPDEGWGAEMRAVQSIMIHETSGPPTYGGKETFSTRYACTVPWRERKNRGLGPQYFVEPNGTAYNLIGDRDLANRPRLTWHGGWPDEGLSMNPLSVGVENGDAGDSSVRPGNGTGPFWALSARDEDLTGMKAYLLLGPDNGEQDAVLIWFARFASEWYWDTGEAKWKVRDGVSPGFDGAADILEETADHTMKRRVRFPKWRNMLFTERNVRSLVLLCRLLAEQHGVPRNFPLLPYAAADPDWGNAGIFRKLILAEQRRDEIARQLGTTREVIEANGPAFREWYAHNPRARWSRLFGAIPAEGPSPEHPDGVHMAPVTPCYRGFLAHSTNGGHPCPGPLFDWHRFAREVWDWWWYPFDFHAGAAGAAPTVEPERRPYFRARRSTPLREYYWDAVGGAAAYDGLREPALAEDTFRLPAATPVYALANGVVVAARLGAGRQAGAGFVLVRHELFHRTTNEHIDYDVAPTYVWTLVRYLDHAGFDIPAEPPAVPAAVPSANPSWLDRFVLRLRECELAVAFHAAHAAAQLALRTGWAHAPDGAGPRAATGREIEQDAAAYRAIARDLIAGEVARFPLVAATDTTPVRVCLGDYLGTPGTTPAGRTGIQVEIFSKVQLPVPNAAQRAVSARAEPWWAQVTETLRHEAAVEADLPDGVAWHYRMNDFATWINRITWRSEWQKYGAPAGTPVPERPITRIVT